MIWNIAIWYEIWFENFAIWFEILLNRGKLQVLSLPTAIIWAWCITLYQGGEDGNPSEMGRQWRTGRPWCQRLQWRSNLQVWSQQHAANTWSPSHVAQTSYSLQTVGPWSTSWWQGLTAIVSGRGGSSEV